MVWNDFDFVYLAFDDFLETEDEEVLDFFFDLGVTASDFMEIFGL
jgi:hypothetical protein